jgi:uncharacterized protein
MLGRYAPERCRVDAEGMQALEQPIARFLLTGASGLLGTAIRSSLLETGAEVLQLVRRRPLGPREEEWFPGSAQSVRDPAGLEGLSSAIHLSGANVAAHRWTPAYRRDMWTSRVESTRALCGALRALERPPQALLIASATGIYGDRGDELLDESSPPGAGFLADLCREWEDAAAPAREAGIRVVHLRFGVVLAREGGALAKMLPAFRLGLGGRMGSGRQWMSWIALDDAVAAMHFLLQDDGFAGPVNLCAPRPVTNSEFTRALAARLGRPAVLAIPAFALRIAFGQMADEALLASARVMPKLLLDAGFPFSRPTIESAIEDLSGSDAERPSGSAQSGTEAK